MPSMPFIRGTPQKAPNNQIILQPIPFPIAIAAHVFPAIPYPAALSHKKRGRPAWDALINSELFSPVSVTGAEPHTEKTHCK